MFLSIDLSDISSQLADVLHLGKTASDGLRHLAQIALLGTCDAAMSWASFVRQIS